MTHYNVSRSGEVSAIGKVRRVAKDLAGRRVGMDGVQDVADSSHRTTLSGCPHQVVGVSDVRGIQRVEVFIRFYRCRHVGVLS